MVATLPPVPTAWKELTGRIPRIILRPIVTRFHTIVVHWRPHTDELYALILLLLLGEAILPGISTAKVEYTRNAQSITGQGWEKDWDNGILYVGCVGGPLDEHARLGKARKEGCSALLVAKMLGIENDPTYVPMLKLINDADNEQQPVDHHLSAVLKLGYDIYRHPKAMKYVMDIVTSFLYQAQKAHTLEISPPYKKATDLLTDPSLAEYWTEAKKLPTHTWLLKLIKRADTETQSNMELGYLLRQGYTMYPDKVANILKLINWCLENDALRAQYTQTGREIVQRIKASGSEQYKEMTSPEGKLVSVLGVETSNFRMASAAFKENVSAVIVSREKGRFVIISNQTQHDNIDMSAVIKALRIAEYVARGGNPADLASIDLTVEGTLKESIMWHYQGDTAQNIFCGSDTVPEQILSKLSLAQVIDIVSQHILKK